MNKEQVLLNTEQYVKAIHEKDSSGHDWFHIQRVTSLAETLGKLEGADLFICKMAAYLHDVADEKLCDNVEEQKKEIENWLHTQNVPNEEKEHILFIIHNMSYKGGNGIKLESIEGQVVQDADRLDALGAIGIARTFMYAGHNGDQMYDPTIPVRDKMSEKEYRQGKSTAINHFYEKLLKLKMTLNTPSGKQLAADRHDFMEQFLSQFHNEWNGKI
ncbi:HD domain-containing protein [Alkalihalobacillus sp. LMS39]|uniref:HD domain-containing protein n=1 Tax=Alkalihalobacillus sp. LMS39 TaxID=2924032 RepID=UPI001FB4F156|nr:HD domain-containing protein [Alkalihalobacillus sp. LMS39]UOE92662.1 HD domain-containing protein [Alkalihalobacillus sp. LMS39]